MLNFYDNYYFFWVTLYLVFKAFFFHFFLVLISIFQFLGFWFKTFIYWCKLYQFGYFDIRFFIVFSTSIFKFYLVNFFTCWINFTFFCLQFIWYFIFFFICFGFTFIFLPYYFINSLFTINYMSWYFNSFETWKRSKYRLESEIKFMKIKKYLTHWQFSPQSKTDNEDIIGVLSSRFIMNADNNLRSVSYFVLFIFFISFIFIIFLFCMLIILYIPIIINFMLTKTVFLSLYNSMVLIFFVFILFFKKLYYFFLIFFSNFMYPCLFLIFIIFFKFNKFTFKNFYFLKKFKSVIKKNSFIIVLFSNSWDIPILYYRWLKIRLVEWAEFTEFLFNEDFEYITSMRFHTYFPSLLDW